MSQTLTLVAPSALGSDVGTEGIGATAGGALVSESADVALLKTIANDILCIQDDGGVYTDDTTDIQDAGADDVPILGATIEVDDAIYFGHATAEFASLQITIGTQGAYTGTTIQWQYWDGDSWEALSGVTDGTTGWTAGTGTVSVTWTAPTDWAQTNVDNQYAYWVRAVCTVTGGTTTQCVLTQGWAVMAAADAVFTDYTTPLGESTDDDVFAVQANLHGTVGDQFIVGHSTQKFCKVKWNYSTASAGTFTAVWKYWDGDSWEALTVVEDKTSSFTTSAADGVVLSFEPPSDWAKTTAANGPNGQVGYFIALEVTVFTSYSAAGKLDEAFMYTVNNSSAVGTRVPQAGSIASVDMFTTDHAGTANDSIFLLVNLTQGTFDSFTWTKTTLADQDNVVVAVAKDDELALVQIQEDGTTEIGATTAGASFAFRLNP